MKSLKESKFTNEFSIESIELDEVSKEEETKVESQKTKQVESNSVEQLNQKNYVMLPEKAEKSTELKIGEES